MQKRLIAITALVFITLGIFTTTFQSCQKDKCKGVMCLNGGACNDGSCICPSGYSGTYCEKKDETTSTLSYKNNAFTTVIVTINGITKTVNPGGTVSFTDTKGSPATGTAFTCGKTTSNTQIGELVQWNINDSYPSVGGTNKLDNFQVDASIFFLYIKNNSSKPWGVLYVNYGLTPQTTDNITIPNDGVTYPVGYYQAYTNSNVRTEDATHAYYWQWNSSQMGLPFTLNQSITLTGN